MVLPALAEFWVDFVVMGVAVFYTYCDACVGFRFCGFYWLSSVCYMVGFRVLIPVFLVVGCGIQCVFVVAFRCC